MRHSRFELRAARPVTIALPADHRAAIGIDPGRRAQVWLGLLVLNAALWSAAAAWILRALV